MKKTIRAIFLDCDGVLTTGSYFYTHEGKFLKEFSSKDGKGFAKAKKRGIHLLVITEEPDEKGFRITQKRCQDQRIDLIRAKNPEDKLTRAKEYADEKEISLEECAFIADDIGDFILFKEVGMPVAVANAYKDLIKYAMDNNGYVTETPGGNGAVREAIEWILDNLE